MLWIFGSISNEIFTIVLIWLLLELVLSSTRTFEQKHEQKTMDVLKKIHTNY